jgi:DNA-binding winged helix-turn-helix (wHTH) protein
VHVKRLRSKLGDQHRVQTVWGRGYLWSGGDERSREEQERADERSREEQERADERSREEQERADERSREEKQA